MANDQEVIIHPNFSMVDQRMLDGLNGVFDASHDDVVLAHLINFGLPNYPNIFLYLIQSIPIPT